MEKNGTVEWTSPGGIVWLWDKAKLLRSNDLSGKETSYIHIPVTSAECTCLPATIQFTKEWGYNIGPGDSVCVACGPKFQTTGVVSRVDFDIGYPGGLTSKCGQIFISNSSTFYSLKFPFTLSWRCRMQTLTSLLSSSTKKSSFLEGHRRVTEQRCTPSL